MKHIALLSCLFLLTTLSCEFFSQASEQTSKPPRKPVFYPVRKPDLHTDWSAFDPVCNAIQSIEKPKPLASLTELERRFLSSHNDIRARYGLEPLSWDDDIARYAQKWADHLKANNKCEMQHRFDAGILEGQDYGENLAWYWTTEALLPDAFAASPEFAVLGWSQECIDYDLKNLSCPPKKICGHFTQVVWRETKKLGCGMALCEGVRKKEGIGRSEVWVCSYDPPGNVSMQHHDGSETPERPF